LDHLDLFACPDCGADLEARGQDLACGSCSKQFPTDENLPRLFADDPDPAAVDLASTVREFYEETPFPNYDDLDTRESLTRKAKRGLFGARLDAQIPPGALVLEGGCGTGQLSNFLGMSWRRKVFGGDMTLHSLRLAEDFRQRFRIVNALFFQMNLLRPPFKPGVFDLVVTNGVLHSTSDPYGGFKALLSVLKPGGCIIVGLYNWIGRLPTLARASIFARLGRRSYGLDRRLSNPDLNRGRWQAWFRDQYEHPHETLHSYEEVLGWFDEDDVEFLSALPEISGIADDCREIFVPHDRMSKVDRWLTEVDMLLEGGRDGGLFIMIGRKRG
jgi:SAM-dependent methyltransferase